MTQQNEDNSKVATPTPQSQVFETEINGQVIAGTIKCVGSKFHATLEDSGVTMILSQGADGQLRAVSCYWPKTGFGFSMLAMEAALRPIIARLFADAG